MEFSKQGQGRIKGVRRSGILHIYWYAHHDNARSVVLSKE